MMSRRSAAAFSVVLVAALVWSGAAVGQPTAAITGSFGDGCRNFAAHSTKDISHVELTYADGRVVKDESTTAPDYAIDGGAGDELSSVAVKSGGTIERFDCTTETNEPPTAILEVLTPAECSGPFSEGGEDWFCDASGFAPRTVWRDINGYLNVYCGDGSNPTCDLIFRLRGTSSHDPNDDLATWTMEFSDVYGTILDSVGGNWSTDPPVEVAYPMGGVRATLTVTDSAGQSASDSMIVFFSTQD